MLRRLLLFAAVALTVALSAGCADDVAPAATVGDRTITHDELFGELDEWAGSPTLLSQLQVGAVQGAGNGTYDTSFVDFVLNNRISFELHDTEFEALGLTLSDQELQDVRTGLFSDPGVTAAVLGELSPDYRETLIAEVARQFAVQQNLGDGYSQWATGAFTGTDVTVDPKLGTWDAAAGSVRPPSGPSPAPTPPPLAQP